MRPQRAPDWRLPPRSGYSCTCGRVERERGCDAVEHGPEVRARGGGKVNTYSHGIQRLLLNTMNTYFPTKTPISCRVVHRIVGRLVACIISCISSMFVHMYVCSVIASVCLVRNSSPVCTCVSCQRATQSPTPTPTPAPTTVGAQACTYASPP